MAEYRVGDLVYVICGRSYKWLLKVRIEKDFDNGTFTAKQPNGHLTWIRSLDEFAYPASEDGPNIVAPYEPNARYSG